MKKLTIMFLLLPVAAFARPKPSSFDIQKKLVGRYTLSQCSKTKKIRDFVMTENGWLDDEQGQEFQILFDGKDLELDDARISISNLDEGPTEVSSGGTYLYIGSYTTQKGVYSELTASGDGTKLSGTLEIKTSNDGFVLIGKDVIEPAPDLNENPNARQSGAFQCKFLKKN
jgi:hypothetical protein